MIRDLLMRTIQLSLCLFALGTSLNASYDLSEINCIDYNPYDPCSPSYGNNPCWLSTCLFTISAEALFWTATETDLAFGVTQKTSSTITDFTTQSGTGTGFYTKHELDFNYHPGYRVTVD